MKKWKQNEYFCVYPMSTIIDALTHIKSTVTYILFVLCMEYFPFSYKIFLQKESCISNIDSRPYIQSCTQKRKNILKSTPFPQEGKFPWDIFRNGGFIFLLYPSRSLCLSLRLYFCLMYVKILCFSWVVIAIYTNVYIK